MLAGGSDPDLRSTNSSERVLSVLFGTGIDEWRRGWSESGAGRPLREAVVTASDVTRGAAASPGATRVLPERDLAHAALGTPIDAGRVVEVVEEFLSASPGGGPTLLVDDLAPAIDELGIDETVDLIRRLAGLAGEADGECRIGCTLRPASAGAIDRLRDVVAAVDEAAVADETGRARAGVDRLSREDPTTFGYVRRHWPEARRGIEGCTRNYPQAKQVHADLPSPGTTPRTLGAALSGLVDLGVIDTWGETVGPTRYDLTAYDEERMAAVGLALDRIE